MLNKNQILVFIISFLIGGFFLLSTPEQLSGGIFPVIAGCCKLPSSTCIFTLESNCLAQGGEYQGDFVLCSEVPGCEPPPIPTLNQWGMIIMAGVLGLFAVIGLLVMRRGSVVKPSS